MNKPFFLLFFLLILSSCNNSESVYMNSVNGNWDQKEELKFAINITDYQAPKNIIFVFRNNNDYPYSNLFVMAYLKEEKQKPYKTDTLNYILAKPSGEWLGTGFGETKEILFQYKTNYKFPKNGKYIIGLKHGMREKNLIGIEDIGVKLENVTIK